MKHFVFTLFLGLALISCSKKDVKQDAAVTETATTDEATSLSNQDVQSSTLTEPSIPSANDLRTIHFDFDSYVITGEGKNTLRNNAQWLKGNPKVTVQIEGHCDERGTNEYNLALGERRANATQTFLISLGVDGSRLSTISYGEERPINTASNEAAWSENRRSEFIVLSR